MELLNFLREEPMMAWFAFLALLVTLVPAVAVFWRRMFRRGQAEVVVKQPVHETKPTRFGNQTELIIILVGLLILLAVINWIRSTFFG